MADLTGNPGFSAPQADDKRSRRRAVTIELIATAALTVSLVVAATAVSLGKRLLTGGHLAEWPPAQVTIIRQ